MDQITIRKSMRNSVVKYNKDTDRMTEFKGVNDTLYRVIDETLNPDSQIVKIVKFKDGVNVANMEFASADFELLVELMSLEERGLRQVEDIDDLHTFHKGHVIAKQAFDTTHPKSVSSNEELTMKNKAAQKLGKLGGSVKSEKKTKAVRENGKKGGRPKKRVASPGIRLCFIRIKKNKQCCSSY